MRAPCLSFLLLAACVLGASACRAEDVAFAVKLGGQAAVPMKDNAGIKASIADAVANDAELEVDVKDKNMIIVNFYPADEKGQPKEGAQPLILLLQNTNKGPINKTMGNKALDAGNWLASITADQKTVQVYFKVK